MGYHEFRSEYDAVLADCLQARLTIDQLAAEVRRLEALVATMEGDAAAQARNDLANLQDILRISRRKRPPARASYERATRIFGAANSDDGTPDERVARARQAIRDLSDLAEQATDLQERAAILSLAEPLELLARSLEPLGAQSE